MRPDAAVSAPGALRVWWTRNGRRVPPLPAASPRGDRRPPLALYAEHVVGAYLAAGPPSPTQAYEDTISTPCFLGV